MRLPFGLENETAIITGAGRGLGLGIARCFHQADARVILIGRRCEKLAAKSACLGVACTLAAEVSGGGIRATAIAPGRGLRFDHGKMTAI